MQPSISGQTRRQAIRSMVGASLLLPGIVAVQTASFDEPDAWPPTVQVQVAERQAWVRGPAALEAHERYPGGP